MKRYKVRFHLARGDNYMKWQVTDLQQDTKSYFDPNLKSIVMRDCMVRDYESKMKLKIQDEAIQGTIPPSPW